MKKLISSAVIAGLAIFALTGCGIGGDSINVTSREAGSGARGSFVELFGIFQDGNDRTTQEANTVNRAGVMLTTVANDANAIGYVSLASLNDSVRALSIDGIAPTVENVSNGTYPIARPFNIVTDVEISALDGVAADFVNFILSTDGQAVVGEEYMSVPVDAAPFTSAQPSGRIVVGGSSSVTPIMERLREAYIEINPNADVEIQSNNSTTGITGARDGMFDIGMSSRDLRAGEDGLIETAIAIDVLTVIVNAQNELTNLTQEQVREIFMGSITSWADLSN